ncbi:MAG: hypothetical protein AB7Q00_16280 [Phycisphaerales bacterium]
MIFIPKCASGLTTLCADQTARYSMTGVRIKMEPDGLFQLAATNGRVLGMLRGPCKPSPKDQEAASKLPAPQSILTETIIDAKVLADALKRIPKKGYDGFDRTLAIQLCNPTLLVAGDSRIEAEPVDGRYPEVMAVIPKRAALASFKLNPRLLIDLLKAAATISETDTDSGHGPWVEILFWAPDQPIGIITRGKDGLAFDGIIMPLT